MLALPNTLARRLMTFREGHCDLNGCSLGGGAERSLAFQHFRDARHQVVNWKWFRNERVAAKKSDRTDLSIGSKDGQADDRHFAQKSVRVNLPCNFVETQVIGWHVEQHQVGLKMKCGPQYAWMIVLSLD